MEATPIRILHLSDFHFDETRTWEADPVLRGLATKVRALADEGNRPDFVAVTGDTGQNGKKP